VTPTDRFLGYWYFHIPHLLMAALIYTLVGRHNLLSIFFKRKPDAVLPLAFARITDLILHAVRVTTPAIVANGLLMIFAIAWLRACSGSLRACSGSLHALPRACVLLSGSDDG
jgi:YggT family protein